MLKKMNRRIENEKLVESAIEKFLNSHSYGPSLREISGLTQLSLGTVHSICKELRDRGILEYADNMSRTLRIKKGQQ